MVLIIYQAASILFSIYLILVSVKKLNVEGGKSVLFLSLASLLYFASNFVASVWHSDVVHLVTTAVSILGMTFVATAIFTFSLEYTFRSYWITRTVVALFAVIPLLTQTGYWVFVGNPNLIFAIEHASSIYRFSLFVAGVWVLGQNNHFFLSKYRDLSYLHVLVGPVLALVAEGMELTVISHLQWFDTLFSVAVLFSLIGFSTDTFLRQPKARQLRRDSVLENIPDVWITLDVDNRIADCNRAALMLFDLPPEKLYGEPVTDVFQNYLNTYIRFDEGINGEIEKSIVVGQEYKYFSIQFSSLVTRANTPVGKLVTLRDITSRKRAEDARRRARDEMFVLLNAVSTAASQSVNLKEFLSDAIFQIIYPFRSQSVFIYVIEDRTLTNKERSDEYYLAAHLGLSIENVRRLGNLSASAALFRWINENKKHILLEDLNDHRFPLSIRALSLSCLLVIPLMVQEEDDRKVIGALFLGRKEKLAYEQDDVVRLTILADHIAALIDSDRRRKLAISMLERQRLMRDIHDSVSQKLYGLVTLTEAAQAAIEAGADFDYDKFLSRIGENARQAVKELRLFLFQLQPVNLEKEGLISVLHHRLAAVEGRADIKVRFLADEPIYISKRKEIAFYYIAQEALNNVLRHAHAKSVTVTLKQGYKYVTLEVADDGCGFDQNSIKQGGLGLENIKERVKQESGKLRISSKPNKGTIIKVTFEQDVPRQ